MIQNNKTFSLTNKKGEVDAYITYDNNFIVLALPKIWGRSLFLDSEVQSGFNLDNFIEAIDPKGDVRMDAILNVASYAGDNPTAMRCLPPTFKTAPTIDKVVMVEQSQADGYATIKIVTPLYEKVVSQFAYIADVTDIVTILH